MNPFCEIAVEEAFLSSSSSIKGDTRSKNGARSSSLLPSRSSRVEIFRARAPGSASTSALSRVVAVEAAASGASVMVPASDLSVACDPPSATATSSVCKAESCLGIPASFALQELAMSTPVVPSLASRRVPRYRWRSPSSLVSLQNRSCPWPGDAPADAIAIAAMWSPSPWSGGKKRTERPLFSRQGDCPE